MITAGLHGWQWFEFAKIRWQMQDAMMAPTTEVFRVLDLEVKNEAIDAIQIRWSRKFY